jgi:hypothetical protein
MSAHATIDASDLLKQLTEVVILNGTCQITLINATPPAWGAVIVSGGVKFFYRDGTDFIDGPKPLSLGSGQSATFVSDKPDGCVFQFFIAFNVRIGGSQQTFTNQDGVGPGECLAHESVTLEPKPITEERNLQSKALENRLQVVVKRNS